MVGAAFLWPGMAGILALQEQMPGYAGMAGIHPLVRNQHVHVILLLALQEQMPGYAGMAGIHELDP